MERRRLVLAGRGCGRQRTQKQERLGDDTLLACTVCAAPGIVERAELTNGDAHLTECDEQLLAVRTIGARQRHEVLHRGVRWNGPGPHEILRRWGERIEQCEPPRYPALRSTEPAREIIERQAVLA